LHKWVSTIAVKYTWAHRLILFLDDLIYGRKPKQKSQPPGYEEYMMSQEDYWDMVNKTDSKRALLTTKGFD
jgi:hypothetical protein